MIKKKLILGTMFLSCLCIGIVPGFGGVPDTGQTTCYDASGKISCPTEEGNAFYGQDAHYLTNPFDYTKLSEDGSELPDSDETNVRMVRDNNTGLIWEINTAPSGQPYTKADEYCGGLVIGLYNDWRLPTREELRTLVNYGKTGSPVIDTSFFPYTQPGDYWAAESAGGTNFWAIDFGTGGDEIKSYSTWLYVRAVRDDNTDPSPRFIDNGDTIKDQATGLTWEKDGSTSVASWQEALSSCEALTLGGNDDWRLPNIKELASIVDLTQTPKIAADFTGTQSNSTDFYWSSTSFEKDDGTSPQAWTMTYNDGEVTNSKSKDTADFYIRAVRGGTVTQGLMGDLNSDYEVALIDALIALKVSAGISDSGLNLIFPLSDVSVNGDPLIGLEEAIYALQVTAKIR